MRLLRGTIVIVGVLLVAVGGCSRQPAAEAPRPRDEQTASRRLPEWAPEKRQALEHFFAVYRQTMKGVPITSEWSEDVEVELYRAGAREDLSNVDLIFDVRAGGAVRMVMYARKADGSYGPPAPLGLGRYYGKGEGR